MAGLNTHPEVIDHRERSLLIAHELVDNVKVREVGANRGYWVERFLSSVGLGKGYAWCAAFVNFQLLTAGCRKVQLPEHPASVFGWVKWAESTGRLTREPQRGDCFFWLDGSHGHIGRFIKWLDVDHKSFETLEGNTNKRGSREGDGAYRNVRTMAELGQHGQSGFISLEGL